LEVEVEVEVELEVEVADSEPAAAVPEDWPPTTSSPAPSWEPVVTEIPTPAPAPFFMYCEIISWVLRGISRNTYCQSSGWDSWESISSNVPVSTLSRAARCTSGRVVSSISSWVGSVLESSLEGGEISELSDGGAGNGDETIISLFLGVFVDETTRVHCGHVGAVKRGDFLELSGVQVATVLGQAVTIRKAFKPVMVTYKRGMP